MEGEETIARYRISRTFCSKGRSSERTDAVRRMFGLSAERANREVRIECRLDIKEGDIVYITGPSGAGKSLLLEELERATKKEERVNLGEIKIPAGRAVIDCIDGDFLSCLKLLSIAGLNDVFCVINRAGLLSDGERYRFRLAAALGLGKRFVFADEFCSNLDRITAAVISYNIQRFAKRNKMTFILAGAHDDILADLSPDVIVTRELSGATQVVYKTKRE